MSTNVEILRTRFEHDEPERLTLFSICCPCFRSRKFKCRASDIALMMYEKDEPHEFVVEKLVIKRVPLRLFGVDEDFQEYEEEMKRSKSKGENVEREIAVTNFDVETVDKVVEEEVVVVTKSSVTQIPDVTSANSLNVNYDTQIESKLTLNCQPFSEPKSGEELILRTITANDEIVTEIDQRIAKMSPDLEKTINVLKGVKPRPPSTQGTPLPVKNQRKRLNPRDIEHDGIITKDAYNYAPCKNDNPLQGIHYSLDKTTFTPIVDEESKSVITDVVQCTKMVEAATTNYEDATEQYAACAALGTNQDGFWSDSTVDLEKNPIMNEYGDDLTLYRVEIPKDEEPKRNLKWKIVINNRPKDFELPTTSTSDFQLENRRKIPKRKRFWRSRRSN